MTLESLTSDLKTVFHRQHGKALSDQQAIVVLRALMSYRDTANHISIGPRHLFQVVAENDKFYGKMAYPCDIIELRRILQNKEISMPGYLSFFAQSCAKRIFKDYSCMLLLNYGPEDLAEKDDFGCFIAGGIAIYDTDRIGIADRISALIVGQGADFDAVERIVSDTIPDCPIYGAAHTPSLERLKISSQNQRFIVNLTPAHIKNWIIKAPTAEEAVDRALAKKWNKLPQSKEEKKPNRFTADFWKNSGFWDKIVRPIGENKKMAQAQGPQLQLTTEEESVFDLIMKIDQSFGLGQQYRVAGGWVRDRILGTQSDDIDIALDKMTGQQFRQYAERYKREIEPQALIGKSYVVDENPDASKHLETTAIQMGPFKIDFVNLRTEDYASDSRIPQMKFGTPEDDATRRDLTINALFYNIGTRQVEDYVGGLQDLESMTLRTPLDGRQTFLDDPLRMLRVLRFHSRYEGSQIAPETMEAMALPEVHDAYRTKVSSERAGPEIMKMFGGATPEESLRVLYETGMDAAILNLPDFQNLQPPSMNQRNPNHQLNWMEHTIKVVKNLNDILAQNNITGRDRSLALMGSWFHDFGKLHPDIAQAKDGNPEHMTYHGHENVSEDLSEAFLKNIGVGKDDREIVNMIVKEHMYPHAHQGGKWGKRMMGKLRSKTTIPGQERDDLWKLVMWHAQADAAAKDEVTTIDDVPEYGDRFRAMEEYMSIPPPAKPLLDGKALMELFPNLDPKKGFIRDINAQLLEEQGAGNIADPEQARAFVENMRPEIESRYMEERQAKSWYGRCKVADASSASFTDSYNAGPDSTPEIDRHKDQIKMIRYNPGASSVYRLGDSVRRRQMGLGYESLLGKIVSKKGTEIRVRWNDGGETETFDIHDALTMHSLERV